MRIHTESRLLFIEGAAPEVLRCEVEVTTYPMHLRVQMEPEVSLMSVEFENGLVVTKSSDYARVVARVFNDREMENHLDWFDVKQLCCEAVYHGEHLWSAEA